MILDTRNFDEDPSAYLFLESPIISSSISNYQDYNDLRIRESRLFLSYIVRDILKDSSAYSFVIQQIQNSYLKSVPTELVLSVFKDKLAEVESKYIPFCAPVSKYTYYSLSQVESTMWRNGIKYFPVITCINPELLEGIPVVKGDFLFSPGLDLPSSDDSNSSDVIFAWQGSIWDNYFKIITLNESQVVDIREPIFVLSLATKNEIELDKKLSSMASPFAVKSNEFLHTENTSLLSTGYISRR